MNASDLIMEFETIGARAFEQMNNPEIAPGVQVQWARVALDAIKALKEEQRLLNDIGAETEFSIIVKPPPLFSVAELEEYDRRGSGSGEALPEPATG